MPLLGLPYFSLGLSLLALLILVALVMVAHGLTAVRFSFPSNRRKNTSSTRKCRYCLWGRSRLTRETTRVEGDDLVDVRCFVCSSCGLPQWSVDRSPVLKEAEK